MIYARIKLNVGGSYVQPLDKLDVLVDEIKNAAEDGNFLCAWNVQLIRMSEKEYSELPEFEGH